MTKHADDEPPSNPWRAETDHRLDLLERAAAAAGWDLSDPSEPPDDPPADPFTQVFEVDFTRADSPDTWLYNGLRNPDQGPRWKGNVEPTTEDEATFLRLHSRPVTEDTPIDGGYVIKAGEWASAGIGIKDNDLTYGAVELEARSPWPTVGTRFAALLWPTDVKWPAAEIDYLEAGGDKPYQDRHQYKISNWRLQDGKPAHDEQVIPCDLTTWHLFRTEWTPDLIRFLVDGVEVWRVTEHVPSGPMYAACQTAQEWAGEKTPGALDVRGWRLYEWKPE